jgi:hypothetical protein
MLLNPKISPAGASGFGSHAGDAIKLRADRYAPTKRHVFSGCRGEPACSPWLNLMALTQARVNQKKI